MDSESENIPLTKRVKGQKIEIKQEQTIEQPVQETKKPISDKKREQMEKARLKKMENAEKRKEEKKIEAYKTLLDKGLLIKEEQKPNISVSEDVKPVKKNNKKIIEVSETESESEPEEIIVVKKKKKKTKTKKIIVEESESDSDSDGGSNAPPPQPKFKSRDMISQKAKTNNTPIDYNRFFC